MASFTWPPQQLTAGSGTVTSVALADASTSPIFGVTGSPVTTTGTLTLTLATQTANRIFAGPASGAVAQPTFRALVVADFNSGTGASNTTFWRGDGTWAVPGGGGGGGTWGSITGTDPQIPPSGGFAGAPFLVNPDGTAGFGLTISDAGASIINVTPVMATHSISLYGGSAGSLRLNYTNGAGAGWIFLRSDVALLGINGQTECSSDGGYDIGSDDSGAATGGRFKNLYLTGTVVTGYQYETPSTGDTITVATKKPVLVIDPAGTIATLTVTLPASPVDGQRCRLGSSQIVTALTLQGAGGATVSNAATALTAGGFAEYIYKSSNTNWYRIG